MNKSFKQRLAALEALEAQQQPAGRVAELDALRPEELAAEAIEAVQDGVIQFHGPADAQPTYSGRYPVDSELEGYAAVVCDRINALLAKEQSMLPTLLPDEVAELREGFQRGDLYVRHAPHAPDHALGRYLRRPNGEVWNTQSGGALSPLSRALVSWAAQCSEELSDEHVLAWLEAANDAL